MRVIWTEQELEMQLEVLNGKRSPTLWIKNARYLDVVTNRWREGNIWTLADRIIFAGIEEPPLTTDTEIFDAAGLTIVPGYIEPHVHPFQLYNPESYALFAGAKGTTIFFMDNIRFFLAQKDEDAFQLMDELERLPFQFYWWARIDSQGIHQHEHEVFAKEHLQPWIDRPNTQLLGEISAWPRLIRGDKNMRWAVRYAKEHGLRIESHLPGASWRTLAKLKLLGATGDHEAMTVEDVEARLTQGYGVTLRYSSIRPDLPQLISGILEQGLDQWDQYMLTTDGSTPQFYEKGVVDQMIEIILAQGVDPKCAYRMASYNAARYYGLDHEVGMIATGRQATLNILTDEKTPLPLHVLSKGKWIVKDKQAVLNPDPVNWGSYDFTSVMETQVELTEDDLYFSDIPFGMNLVNDVITKVYEIDQEGKKDKTIESRGRLESYELEDNELYMVVIDRAGKWRVRTILKGFVQDIDGLATSYSLHGDFIIIGRSKKAMRQAFQEIKNIGGGIVLMDGDKVEVTIPLVLNGLMSDQPMEMLMKQEHDFVTSLRERGYGSGDPIYTLFFLMSTHLPYIRATSVGLYDVLKNEVITPVEVRS